MLVISHSHKFIFVHVFKVAGQSMYYSLRDYARPSLFKRLLCRVGLAQAHGRPKELPVHAKAREVQAYLPPATFQSYYKFAFVRNPWDWQVSIYHHVLQRAGHPLHQYAKSLNGFDDYIKWVTSGNMPPQKDFVTDENGELIVDFVGRFERLQQDFGHVCRHLGLRIELPHYNKSSRRPYQEYYNWRTRKLVERQFQADIDFFGYEFDNAEAPASLAA